MYSSGLTVMCVYVCVFSDYPERKLVPVARATNVTALITTATAILQDRGGSHFPRATSALRRRVVTRGLSRA